MYLARCVDRKAHAKSARQNFTSLNSLAIVGPCAEAIANPCLGRGWRHSDGHWRIFALATDFSFAGRPPCSGTDVWNGHAGKQEHAVGERSSALGRRQIICSYRSTFRSRPDSMPPAGRIDVRKVTPRRDRVLAMRRKKSSAWRPPIRRDGQGDYRAFLRASDSCQTKPSNLEYRYERRHSHPRLRRVFYDLLAGRGGSQRNHQRGKQGRRLSDRTHAVRNRDVSADTMPDNIRS